MWPWVVDGVVVLDVGRVVVVVPARAALVPREASAPPSTKRVSARRATVLLVLATSLSQPSRVQPAASVVDGPERLVSAGQQRSEL